MIYFFVTMLALAAWTLCDVLLDEVKQNKVERKRKFAIPPEFWDDYNKCLFFIERMGINEVGKTQYMVDDIIFKYHECLDYVTFTERISILIEKIENKKRSFLLIDSLN
tara:strand:+ start:402 stop:728 length:327 start_codon:yes stop_codon:yes gene_type:complete